MEERKRIGELLLESGVIVDTGSAGSVCTGSSTSAALARCGLLERSFSSVPRV